MAVGVQFTVWEHAVEVPVGDVLQENVVAVGGTSTQSAAIAGTGRKRRRVRIAADTDCWVTWGADPTALNTGLGGRMFSAGDREYHDIEAGYRLAVISRT